MLQLGPYTLPTLVWLHVAYLTLQGLQLAVFSDTQDTLSGVGLLGIAAGYVVTAQVHPDHNYYLHASVPLRLILAGLAGIRLAMAKRRDEKATQMLWGILLYDGIGALLVGYSLGNFSGRLIL